GIYLRDDYPEAYAEALRDAGRVRFSVTYNTESIVNVLMGEAGPWLASARLASGEDATVATAPLWSDGGYILPQTLAGERTAYVFPTLPLPQKTLSFVKVWRSSGVVDDVPVALGEDYALPPLVS